MEASVIESCRTRHHSCWITDDLPTLGREAFCVRCGRRWTGVHVRDIPGGSVLISTRLFAPNALCWQADRV